MEESIFTIDSIDKRKFTTAMKIFHIFFGVILIVLSSFFLHKFRYNTELSISLYANICIFIIGVLWIIRGFLGRDFLTLRRKISISDDEIILKKPFQKKIQFSKDSIDQIIFKPSVLHLTLKNSSFIFNLKWVTYLELKELEENLIKFCRRNKIELK